MRVLTPTALLCVPSVCFFNALQHTQKNTHTQKNLHVQEQRRSRHVAPHVADVFIVKERQHLYRRNYSSTTNRKEERVSTFLSHHQ